MQKVQIELSAGQVKLLLAVLDEVSEHYSNHGCNDTPNEWRQMVTDDEWDAIGQATDSEYDGYDIGDTGIMDGLASLIRDSVTPAQRPAEL